MIEVEKKALFDESSKEQIVATILAQAGAVDLGENNTDSVFYITSNELVKVQTQVSKGTAKIAWKSGGNTGASTRREIELPIAPSNSAVAEQLVEAMLPNAQRFPTKQLRHDYQIGELTVSVKYSDEWKHHLEIDRNVTQKTEVPEAVAQIEALAQLLGVDLLTEAEEKAFVAQILAERGAGAPKRGKLVRDKIPDLIRAQGREPAVRTLTEDEYRVELVKKLHEEVAEFTQDNNAEELADVLEVVHALAQDIGLSLAELEQTRARKAADRGAFTERTYLTID